MPATKAQQAETRFADRDAALRYIVTASPEEMEELTDAIRRREKALARKRLSDIKVGDTIEIVGNISPRYLVGALAKVTGKRKSKVEAELLTDAGRYRAGVPVGIPTECVRVVES